LLVLLHRNCVTESKFLTSCLAFHFFLGETVFFFADFFRPPAFFFVALGLTDFVVVDFFFVDFFFATFFFADFLVGFRFVDFFAEAFFRAADFFLADCFEDFFVDLLADFLADFIVEDERFLVDDFSDDPLPLDRLRESLELLALGVELPNALSQFSE